MIALSEDPSLNEGTDDDNNDTSRIVPRVSIFCYNDCAVRVQSTHSDGSVECVVLQLNENDQSVSSVVLLSNTSEVEALMNDVVKILSFMPQNNV